jgi:uncharacterized protein (TIGR00369 family)
MATIEAPYHRPRGAAPWTRPRWRGQWSGLRLQTLRTPQPVPSERSACDAIDFELRELALEKTSGSNSGEAFARAPISQLVGLEVEPGELGEAVVRLPVGPRMHNPMGAVHGGVIALLADAAMGIAFGRTLVDASSFATIEMKVSYLRPVKESLLTATAKLVGRGLRVGFVECVITDARSKEIARASCTCTVNSLEQSAGYVDRSSADRQR